MKWFCSSAFHKVCTWPKDLHQVYGGCLRHLPASRSTLSSFCWRNARLRPSDVAIVLQLQNCIAEVNNWCAAKWLQLNADKTDLLWFGWRSVLEHIYSWMTALIVNFSKSEFLLVVLNVPKFATRHSTRLAGNLGFILDKHLSVPDQTSSLSKTCYFHICVLCCIRPYLDFKIASTITTSTVYSKLDYLL